MFCFVFLCSDLPEKVATGRIIFTVVSLVHVAKFSMCIASDLQDSRIFSLGLEGIADLDSLRGAFQRMVGWVFPKSGPKDAVQDEKKKSMLAQMAREYQEALDAEIQVSFSLVVRAALFGLTDEGCSALQTVQDKLDRSKWGALGSWLGGAKQKEAGAS